MEPKGRIEVSADVSANVIRLSFVGVLTVREMELYIIEIGRVMESIQPGFSLLTDLTDLEFMGDDCIPAIDQTMELMKRRGVGLVIRVIPDRTKDIGMSIMSLFHYPRRLKIVTTESREEAAAILRQRT